MEDRRCSRRLATPLFKRPRTPVLIAGAREVEGLEGYLAFIGAAMELVEDRSEPTGHWHWRRGGKPNENRKCRPRDSLTIKHPGASFLVCTFPRDVGAAKDKGHGWPYFDSVP